jgi:hypothetical protein
MSERTTRKDVESALVLFCKAFGYHLAGSWNDVGGLQLDHAACYGGYVVEEITSKGGAVSRPFGDYRRPAGEMRDTLLFAYRAKVSKGRS